MLIFISKILKQILAKVASIGRIEPYANTGPKARVSCEFKSFIFYLQFLRSSICPSYLKNSFKFNHAAHCTVSVMLSKHSVTLYLPFKVARILC